MRRAALALLAIVIVLTFIGVSVAGPQPAWTDAASRLAEGGAAATGFGQLAYIQRGALFVLDGKTGKRASLVPASALPSQPAWSPDGRWLAYLRGSFSESSNSRQLWISRADGRTAHRVGGLPGSVADYQWSPTSDRIAVTSSHGLWIMQAAGGSPFDMAKDAPQVESFAWSPDGAYLAFSGRPSGLSRRDLRDWLYTVGTVGGAIADTPRFVSRPSGGHDNGILVAGWWPDGKGILFWLDPYHSGSIAADGLQLYSVDFPYGRVRPLTGTLVYRDWLAPAPNGNSLLVVAGGYRSAYFGKQLALCRESGSCHPIAQRRGQISVDPAWSPAGNGIVFVEAQALSNTYGFGSNGPLRRWLATRTLWTANPDGSDPHQVTSVGTGISAPQWSRDGGSLLFVKDNALWLAPHIGAANARKLVQLLPPQLFPPVASGAPDPYWDLFYYGHVRWHSLFAWYS